MDSLARATHSYFPDARTNPVVTAVGFEPTSDTTGRIAIAHNKTDAFQRSEDARRLDLIHGVLKGERNAGRAAQSLAPDSGLGRGAEDRLAADLRKLRGTYEGRDDQRGGAELRRKLEQAFPPSTSGQGVNWVDKTMPVQRGAVHGEAALVAQGVPGHLGVSKLSCQDCFDYAEGLGRADHLRGTHGQNFPGWTHPTDLSQSTNRVIIPGTRQYASDSDSDA